LIRTSRVIEDAHQARSVAHDFALSGASAPDSVVRPTDAAICQASLIELWHMVSMPEPIDAGAPPSDDDGGVSVSDLDGFDTYFFESSAAENGTLAWHEDSFMLALGYQDRQSFRKVVRRAMQACLTLNIEPTHDFIPVGDSYKFTRFACYLIAMNGDARKRQVATAQIYFASLANSLHSHREQAEIVDRVLIREEMKDGMKSLSGTAKQHGVQSYALFLNAGYRGMYNMGLKELERRKGVGAKENLLDRMDRAELAANLFRVTQTDTKIRNDNIRGQSALESTALAVGKSVRNLMIEINQTRPEDLPLAQPIREARKSLKETGKKMKELSSPPAARQLLLQAAAEAAEAADALVEAESSSDADKRPSFGYTADPEEDTRYEDD
jgi:DNA-damage-inducible protein D